MANGDKWQIFEPEGKLTRNIHLDWFGGFTPRAMAEAFKDAADAAIERSEEDVTHPDRYVYPVAYLFRHHVELQLKNIIDLGKHLLPDKFGTTGGIGHKLRDLWNDAVVVIEFGFPLDDRTILESMEKIVLELHRADPDGQSFRYHRNTRGEVNLPSLPRVFSLRQLQREIHKLSDFLEGCCMAIDEELQCLMEMEPPELERDWP